MSTIYELCGLLAKTLYITKSVYTTRIISVGVYNGKSLELQ